MNLHDFSGKSHKQNIWSQVLMTGTCISFEVLKTTKLTKDKQLHHHKDRVKGQINVTAWCGTSTLPNQCTNQLPIPCGFQSISQTTFKVKDQNKADLHSLLLDLDLLFIKYCWEIQHKYRSMMMIASCIFSSQLFDEM